MPGPTGASITASATGAFDALKSFLKLRSATGPASQDTEYARLYEEPTALGDDDEDVCEEVPFSWMEYWLFGIVGMAMLWPWNMFLASTPYFQARFDSSPVILRNFQSGILSISTICNLVAMWVLTKSQHNASYTFRMNAAFAIHTVVFTLLSLSTLVFIGVSPGVYLFFTLTMVATAALATALIQNGSFAFCASFNRPEYMQALMAGQGVAGVLPAIAQVIVSLSVDDALPEKDIHAQAVTSAFLPFMTAVLVSLLALASLIPLIRRHRHLVESRMVERVADSVHSIADAERAARKTVPMKVLAWKLRWPAAGVFMCFVVAMFFPVFSGKIVSVRGETTGIFKPASFIPLGFLMWNVGDLLGRIVTAIPIPGASRPKFLFLFSLLRIGFLPLYFLCNIGGRGAALNSDFFYLFIIQIPFGLTNGWLCGACMVLSGDCVDDSEREAAGGFMGLALVAGLSVGSVLSFTVAGV